MTIQEATEALAPHGPNHRDEEDDQIAGRALAILLSAGFHDFAFEYSSDLCKLTLYSGDREWSVDGDRPFAGRIQYSTELLVTAAREVASE